LQALKIDLNFPEGFQAIKDKTIDYESVLYYRKEELKIVYIIEKPIIPKNF
jgi:hypothetical protein